MSGATLVAVSKLLFLHFFKMHTGFLRDFVALKASHLISSCIAHSPEHWKDLDKSHCGDSYQSPIDIVTSIVTKDTSLKHFNFTNFNSTSAIKTITNNGHSGIKQESLRCIYPITETCITSCLHVFMFQFSQSFL